MTDELFVRAERAINKALALRAERQRLMSQAERLLDDKSEILKRLAFESRSVVKDVATQLY